jgi:ABC-2 type transport system ATP-binding protein
MDNGKIIEQGKPQTLIQKHFSGALIRLPRGSISQIETLPFDKVQVNEQLIEITSIHVDRDLNRLLSLNISLDGLYIHNPNLDDLFLKLTGHQLRS